jgi:hypothetical protein
MTWLGKILTFVVMVGTVVWGYLTVQAYVTRVNWKTELERERVAHRETAKRVESDYRLFKAREDALIRANSEQKALIASLNAQVAKYDKDAAELAAVRADFQTKQKEYDTKQMVRQGTITRTLAELVTVRARSEVLENQVVTLTRDAEEAKKQATKANNEAKLARAIADENARRVDELQARLSELRSGGRDLLSKLNKPAPPVLSNLRGEVTDVAGDLVTLSVGIDAGLGVGTTLDIYRLDGGPRYLGTVKVTNALNLFPKQAIATFTPARNVPFDRLRPEELPKKGDEVRPLNALTGGGP